MSALDAEAIEHALLDALSAGEDVEVRPAGFFVRCYVIHTTLIPVLEEETAAHLQSHTHNALGCGLCSRCGGGVLAPSEQNSRGSGSSIPACNAVASCFCLRGLVRYTYLQAKNSSRRMCVLRKL